MGYPAAQGGPAWPDWEWLVATRMAESRATADPDAADTGPAIGDAGHGCTDEAARHTAARRNRAAALLQDYVEMIDDLVASEGEARPTDIARRLGVSHATVIKVVGRLKREGLATGKPYRGVFLTDAGRALAERVRTRHRLVVDVLLALGVPEGAAEADAEGIEHHVGDETLRAFRRFLGREG